MAGTSSSFTPIANTYSAQSHESTEMNNRAATCADIDYSPIVNINDDCLREIFGYLNVIDAVNIASTCKRLRCFANENHYPKFIKFEIKPDVLWEESRTESPITINLWRTMMKHFGSIIEEMDFWGANLPEFHGDYLHSLLELCPNLHTLRIRNFRFFCWRTSMSDFILKGSKIKSGIKVLEIYECMGMHLSDTLWTIIIVNFHELRSLNITSSRMLGPFFTNLNNLESLELQNCGVTESQLEIFCENNGATMRKLKLVRCQALRVSVFPMITSKLPEIEELEIDMNSVTHPDQLNCLEQLNHLKKLIIVILEKPLKIGSFLQLLGNRGLLELLEIYGGVLDAETFGSLNHFQRLKTLRLLYPKSEVKYMMDMIVDADLPELVEFYAEACDSITDANLVAMVTSKPSLTIVDVLFNKKVTFAAVRQITNVLKSDFDGNRPHLKLNIDTIKLGEEEVTL